VAELAAVGRTNREIADELFVTAKAVEWHRGNSNRKLGIRGRVALAGALGKTDGPCALSRSRRAPTGPMRDAWPGDRRAQR